MRFTRTKNIIFYSICIALYEKYHIAIYTYNIVKYFIHITYIHIQLRIYFIITFISVVT